MTQTKTDNKPKLYPHGVNMAAWRRLPVHNEPLTEPDGGMDRRDVLKIMGASAALAMGVPGCKRKPQRQIISRAVMPEYEKPGKILEYASTWTEGAFPYGTIVRVIDNRPIKVDGNPDHPVNAGTSSAQMQASILSLYDPDRMRQPKIDGADADWQAIDKKVIGALQQAKSVVLLTRATLGPSERQLVSDFTAAKSGAKHLVYEAIHDGPRRRAWGQIFGKDGEWIPDFSKADVILSLEGDFLGTEPTALEATQQFASRRNPAENDGKMNRLWVAESAMTVTGSNADVRLRVKPSAMPMLAAALLAAVRGEGAALNEFAAAHHLDDKLLRGLAEDLKVSAGKAVVVAGGHLPEAVHAEVAMLNDAVKAPGNTLQWNTQPASLPVSSSEEILSAIKSADVLICLGVNPLYSMPGLSVEGFKQVALTVGHDLYETETLQACNVALPSHHNLESWNDAIARAGVESLCQPMLHPLWKTRQEAESLLRWAQALTSSARISKIKDWHDFVQQNWMARNFPNAASPTAKWQESLRKGVVVKEVKSSSPRLDTGNATLLAQQAESPAEGKELVIWPDGMIHDGRFANSSWLMETPDPVTRIVWDTAALMSPATALKLDVAIGDYDRGHVEGDTIDVMVDGKTVNLPVMVVPGMADDVIAANTGYGRTSGGVVCKNKGRNVSSLIGAGLSGRVRFAVKATRSDQRYPLVRTQKTMVMKGDHEKHNRPIALDGTLEEFNSDNHFVEHLRHLPPKSEIYAGHDYSQGPRWHMVIDMNKCTGCSACVTACQAENNIPVVGKNECANGREMHWMRIDRYYSGDENQPTVSQQPMLCQHCENAPCENVCPVNATSHSIDGLNEMTYNRCIATRYCLNNCPYKVRRFNFFDYSKQTQPEPVQKPDAPTQQLLYNPQVTVRMRGVMEKCTFCVQRLNRAKFAAKNANKPIADGAAVTACQQACPANAIAFGNIHDKKSDVAQQDQSPLMYYVLEELNIKPSVGYLAKVRNPHPVSAMTSEDAHHSSGEHG